MRRPAWGATLSVQAALVQAASVGVRVMIGYRAIALGADPMFLGLLAASFALPALLASFLVGRWGDRVGGAVPTLVGGVLMVAGMLSVLTLPGLSLLLVASAAIGLGHLCAMVGQQTIVAHRSANGPSEGSFGNLSAAASVGQLVGAPLVTTAAAFGAGDPGRPDTTLGIYVCLALSLLALPAFLLLYPAERDRRRMLSDRPRGDNSARTVLTTPGLWRALVVSGAVLATSDLIYAFLPVWAIESGVSAVAVGWLLALRAGVSVLSRLGLTTMVTRFGRRALLLTAMLIGSVALAALPLSGLPGAILVMLALGITLGLPQPLTMAWVVSATASSQHGAALGLRISANRLAQVTLPLAAGTLAAPLGIAGVFWANALLLGAAALVIPRDDTRRPEHH